MKSPVVKRSIVIAGHKTSVSLEDEFWKGLKEIATDRDMTLSDLVGTIDTDRQQGNLSSAIRLFVLNHYRERVGDDHRALVRDAANDVMEALERFEPVLTADLFSVASDDPVVGITSLRSRDRDREQDALGALRRLCERLGKRELVVERAACQVVAAHQ